MPSLVMKLITNHFILGILLIILLVLQGFAHLNFFNFTSSMSTVRTKAHPTEGMFAHLALHTVASLILFDCRLALGTLLCVRFHPCDGVFVTTLFFIFPLLDMLTRRWFMLLVLATKAICFVAVTGNWCLQCKCRLFDHSITLMAFFHILVEICELFCVPFHVVLVVVFTFCIRFVLQVFLEDGMWNYHIASKLDTSREYTSWAFFFDFFLKLSSPSTCAELMTTTKWNRFHIRVSIWTLFKITVHNHTHTTIFVCLRCINIWVLLFQLGIILNTNFLFKCILIIIPFSL